MKRTWALGPIILALAHCGGAAASDEPSGAVGAAGAAGEHAEGAAGQRAEGAAGSAGLEATASEGVSCENLRRASIEALDEAAAAAPTECSAHSDCMLFGRRPKCVHDCGFFAPTSDSGSLEAAVARVDAELCPVRCEQVPSSCGGGVLLEDTPLARCDRGQCVMLTWQDVFEARFQTTIYPLLVSHCQSCHDSSSEQRETPFADSNPAVALAATNNLVSWASDAAGVRISNPSFSTLARRIEEQRHHCWSDCTANRAEIAAALDAWSAGD